MFAINHEYNYITKDNKPFFYTADTIWSAFTNMSFDEWNSYLDYRKIQNYNVLQISVLPILHDRSMDESTIQPFAFNASGVFDYSAPNDVYFDKAEKMLEMAKNKGFTPALVAVWISYVKGSWVSKDFSEYAMDADQMEGYIDFITDRFNRFEPIYIVSGDARFDSDYIADFYQSALHRIKKNAPESIATFHVFPEAELPESIISDENLDFYMYQSGHDITGNGQRKGFIMAEQYTKLRSRPIVNGEPCYEGHGYGHHYGRFDDFHVRRASWQSVLAGAKAGITYGAHGVWSWHKPDSSFSNASFSDKPFNSNIAMTFQGAYDIGYLRWLFESYHLFEVMPRNELLLDDRAGSIRLACDAAMQRLVVYLPYTTEITINLELQDYQFYLHVIGQGNTLLRPNYITRDGKTIFDIYPMNADAVLVCLKE